MCIASGSIRGLFVSEGINGSSYSMAFAAKWAITCVSGNGFVCGE